MQPQHLELEEHRGTPGSKWRCTRTIEQQAAKITSATFLTAALGALGASLALELAGRTRASRFIGMWPSTLLIMGVYNKLVKTLGPQ